jgi:hypothetical protein
MIILVIGVLLVGGLVAWALTRTVDVSSTPPPPEQTAQTTPPFDPSALNATAAQNTPPLASTSTSPSSTDSATSTFTPPLRPPQTEGDKQSIARIAPEDLKSKWGRGEVTVVDVRDELSYNASHIPGALHMQLATIEGRINELPKGKPIVLYCT